MIVNTVLLCSSLYYGKPKIDITTITKMNRKLCYSIIQKKDLESQHLVINDHYSNL